MSSVSVRRRSVGLSLLGLGLVFVACGQEPREETTTTPVAPSGTPAAVEVPNAPATVALTAEPAAPGAPAPSAHASGGEDSRAVHTPV